MVESVLLYGCTTWNLTQCMEKKRKLDGNFTRMLRAVWNKSWRQHPTKQQLYRYLTLSSRNPSKLDEQDMWDTAEEIRASL